MRTTSSKLALLAAAVAFIWGVWLYCHRATSFNLPPFSAGAQSR